MGKSSPKISKKLPNLNKCPVSKNLPNLVTLHFTKEVPLENILKKVGKKFSGKRNWSLC
jgi:hypothetical protein